MTIGMKDRDATNNPDFEVKREFKYKKKGYLIQFHDRKSLNFDKILNQNYN